MSIYELHRRRLVQVRGELEESRVLNRELLEALKEGVRVFGPPEDWQHPEGVTTVEETAVRMMKAAIDKAERGTQ